MKPDFKLIFFLLILLFANFQGFAQNSKDFERDSLKLDQFFNNIKKIHKADNKEYQNQVNAAELELKKHPYTYSRGLFLLAKSSYYFEQNDLETAEKYVDEAYKLFSSLKDRKNREIGFAKSHILKAVLAGYKGDKKNEQELYFKAIPILEKYNDLMTLNTAYGNLGLIFYENQQFQKAEEYFLKSYHTGIDSQVNSKNLGNSELNLVMVNYQLGNLDQMKSYLDLAKKNLSKNSDSLKTWALYFNLKGDYGIANGQYDEAIADNLSALKVAEKYKDNTFRMNSISGIAHAYFLKGDYKQSIKYLKQYNEDTKKYNLPQSTLSSLLNLADMEHKLGNSEQAYFYMLEYSTLKDSLDQKMIVDRIYTLEAEFQSAKKEKQITQLQLDNERKEWRLKQNLIWIIGCVSAILILGGISLLLYRNSRNQKLLNEQEKSIHQSNLQQIEQQHQIDMLSSLMKGAETERQRLGRDLHDGLGGLLSGIKFKLNSIPNQTSDENLSLQKEVKNDLDDAIQEMRFISQGLLPDLMEKYGLDSALEQFCSRISTEELNIEYQSINFTGFSSKEKELMFYRIVQELVNNAVKHAKANEILVQLQQRENQVFLTVEDDGVGWDTDNGSFGSGLNNLKYRIEFLKGKLDFSTQKGEGTSFYISCPV